jgi:hypothetical protein
VSAHSKSRKAESLKASGEAAEMFCVYVPVSPPLGERLGAGDDLLGQNKGRWMMFGTAFLHCSSPDYFLDFRPGFSVRSSRRQEALTTFQYRFFSHISFMQFRRRSSRHESAVVQFFIFLDSSRCDMGTVRTCPIPI